MNNYLGQATKKFKMIDCNKSYVLTVILMIILSLGISTTANAESNESFNYEYGWWSAEGYNANYITDNTVSGDFDGDGKDDIAALYNYGIDESRIHVFKSTGGNFSYQTPNGWWKSNGYDSQRVKGRSVSGDFNGDGKDDIAAFYDYGNGETRIHVFLSDGSKFNYQGPAGWWSPNGYYDANMITNRVVSGDFNGDGKDDIAAFYDYGNSKTRVHIFLSDGSKFIYPDSYGWWSPDEYYDANMITDRVASGDFNGDGKDDIVALYDYGNGESRMHAFLSDGSKLNYQGSAGWWRANSYYANMVTGRLVSGDFNNDGKDDIATLYDYENSESRMHAFLSDGSKLNYQGPAGWWKANSYDANMVTGRLVSGNFDGIGGSDIGMVYDYSNSVTKIHMLLSTPGETQADKVIAEAYKHLGKPYVWGATGPNSFDCSGFTQYVYKQALGITLPRVISTSMSSQRGVGTKISSISDLRVGDLVITNNYNHVGIYVGNGQYINAAGDDLGNTPGLAYKVIISNIYGFNEGRRVVN